MIIYCGVIQNNSVLTAFGFAVLYYTPLGDTTSLHTTQHNTMMNSPHKGQWRWALMFSLICTWINRWVNNREAGDLRRHRAHYDVIVLPHYTAPYCRIYLWFTHIGCSPVTFTNDILYVDDVCYISGRWRLHFGQLLYVWTTASDQGHLLLTWINFNRGMDK